jgi:2-polyprenyl-6-methoxyphenol hydroxylase-like FAD-dependent oxidoreductase
MLLLSSRGVGSAPRRAMSTDASKPPKSPGLVSSLLLVRRRRADAADAAAGVARATTTSIGGARRRRSSRFPTAAASTDSTTTTTTTAATSTTTTVKPPTTAATTTADNAIPLLPPGLPSAAGRAVVVGAGPSGIAAAIALARRGFSVDVFERRPRGEGSDPRRTFGIVLGERALKSLERVGVDVRPLRRGRRMLGSVVATQQGLMAEDVFADPTADDADDVVVESDGGSAAAAAAPSRRPAGRLMVVERAAVVAHLLAEAERLCPPADAGGRSRPLRFHWSRPLDRVDFDGRVATFGVAGGEGDDDGSGGAAPLVAVPYDLLVAADGASSAVRAQLESAGRVTVTRLPSPASSMEYATFHGLSDADALGAPFFVPQQASASGGTFFYTFLGARSMEGSSSAPYAGSVAMYRRPDSAASGGPGRGWSGIVALPPGKYDALLGADEDAYAAALDPLLPPAGEGASACAKFAAFPAPWRRQIARQLAAAGREAGSIGRLTPLASSSAVALPAERVAMLGDAASSNTPQMGQGAGSALEDAALLTGRLDEQAAAAAAAAAAAGGGGGGAPADDEAAVAALLLQQQHEAGEPPLAAALAAYDAARAPQRRALQALERELAVYRRPPPPGGQEEPAEDRRARRAWRAFMAQQRLVGRAARAAAALAGWVAVALAPALAAVLLAGGRRGGGGGGKAAASPLAIAARVNQWTGWTQLLHSGVAYDDLLRRVHAAPAANASAAAALAVAAAAALAKAVSLVVALAA